MEAYGAPQHLVDKLKQSQTIEILPRNWLIVCWFNDVCDLMRYHNNGACLGLDLAQVQCESSMSERTFTTDEFSGLRIMSKAAAIHMNKG